MKEVLCNECGKYLFSTEKESAGAIGAEAQQNGFVYKNAALFSVDYSSLYFCDHECGKAFYKKNIPPKAEMTKTINDLKKEIPRMASDCSKGIARMIDAINQHKT